MTQREQWFFNPSSSFICSYCICQCPWLIHACTLRMSMNEPTGYDLYGTTWSKWTRIVGSRCSLLGHFFESLSLVMHWSDCHEHPSINGSADRPRHQYVLIARAPHALGMPHGMHAPFDHVPRTFETPLEHVHERSKHPHRNEFTSAASNNTQYRQVLATAVAAGEMRLTHVAVVLKDLCGADETPTEIPLIPSIALSAATSVSSSSSFSSSIAGSTGLASATSASASSSSSSPSAEGNPPVPPPVLLAPSTSSRSSSNSSRLSHFSNPYISWCTGPIAIIKRAQLFCRLFSS
jgi:hypothetical protein